MLLAMDTATSRASIALHDGRVLRSEHTWEAVRRHTVTLAPRIRHMLTDCRLEADALTAIAVSIGPGSYTGVRIGVAVAQGMAASGGLPLIGVSTLDILAAAQPPDPRPLYALFAAGRRRVGYARYRWVEDRWCSETGVKIAAWPELVEIIAQTEEPALVVGEIGEQGYDALMAVDDQVELPDPAWHLRRAGFLAELAWARARVGESGDPAALIPLYVR